MKVASAANVRPAPSRGPRQNGPFLKWESSRQPTGKTLASLELRPNPEAPGPHGGRQSSPALFRNLHIVRLLLLLDSR